ACARESGEPPELAEGVRRSGGELRGDRLGARLERIGRHDLRHETPRERLLGAEDAVAQQELLRTTEADKPRQPPRAPAIAAEPELCEGGGEDGVLGRDDDVAAPREPESAAGDGAIDRGDDGRLEGCDLLE